jgi:HD-GYP domain-containing protein (c-di-GMP phosphodiesterase class II)
VSPAPDELLLRDLLAGLSIPRPDSARSVGIVGHAAHAPQPPAHCLRACLDGDPSAWATRGCAFLAAAARNEFLVPGPHDHRCSKGFEVAAQPTTIGGVPAVLVTVEGRLASGAPRSPGLDLLGHLDSAARLVLRVGRILEENAGFANEVLQSYEQLNLIFDLTQQIAQVTGVRAIEGLLLRRLARLLAAPVVWVMTTDGERRVYAPSDDTGSGAASDLPCGAAPTTAVDAVRRTRQVRVFAMDGRPAIGGPLVRLDDHVDVVLAVRSEGAEAFKSCDMLLLESVLTFGGQIISNSEVHDRLRRMSMEVTRALVAAIDKKDHYTSGHSELVESWTRLTAQDLGLPAAQQQIMEWAGLLHDVGKIGIPEETLCKPGKLTKAEFDVIKRHPRMGYEILKPIASFELVLDGVLYHHEQPDGRWKAHETARKGWSGGRDNRHFPRA